MNKTIVMNELRKPINVADYLFRRLYQVGIRAVHGVPGDYNLAALDHLAGCGLYWVGNCNELNAGYAADGYARINGIGALVTAFGVGELSALNAIAGAYSEFVPIVHIVGQPSTVDQKHGMLLHHTLGNGDFSVFAHMSAGISCAVGLLNATHEIPTLIDNAIRECWVRSRPVYITLPTDVVEHLVEGERLDTAIDLSPPPNDNEKEDYVVDVVLRYLHAAEKPVLLVDACAIRHRVLDEVHELMEKSGLPTFVAPMGKGAVNETYWNYGGVYAGTGSNAGVRDVVETSDLILSIGAIKSDFNTAGFSYRIGQLHTIDFQHTYVRVRYSEYSNVNMKGVLRKMIQKMGPVKTHPVPHLFNAVPKHEGVYPPGVITHDWLWPTVSAWLKENDIVITETGTANFGIWETRFPANVTAISQVLWGSIGYSVGACQGATLAAKEKGARRTVLFVGDGSLQLTVQELSTMIKHGLNPIIFVICNQGYTIERYIHGWGQSYNDIQPWDFSSLPASFGANGRYKGYKAATKDELIKLLTHEEFQSPPYLQAFHMPLGDAPLALKITAEAASERNK
ncbi:pyruvate decarboxylase [Aspergillus flavus AF70]|nr:pyruvate decarboxylase [Aspergillus flavus AF70]